MKSFLRLFGKNPHLIFKTLADSHPSSLHVNAFSNTKFITDTRKILEVNQNLEPCLTLLLE